MNKIKNIILLFSLLTVVSCQRNEILSASSAEKKVTFKNIDGSVIEEQTVLQGNKASFTEASPTFNDDSNRVFSFKDWDKSLDEPIKEDTVFTAQYDIVEYTGLSFQYEEASNSFSVQIKDDMNKSLVYIPSIHSEEGKTDVPVKKILRRNKVSDDIIKKVYMGDNIEALDNSAFAGFHELTEITLGSKLKTVPAYTFQNDKKLASVIGFEQIEVFGPSAFNGTGLTSVTLGNNVKKYENNLGGSEEAEAIFSYCSNLKEVNIDNNLPIPSNMFSNCENLEKVTIKNVPEIKGQAFFEDSKLASLNLGEGLTSIGMLAFSGNSALTSVSLPSTLKTLENFAFEKTGIEKLTLPSSLEKVGRGILSGAKDPSKVEITVNKKKSEMTGFDENWAYDYQSGTTYSFKTLD